MNESLTRLLACKKMGAIAFDERFNISLSYLSVNLPSKKTCCQFFRNLSAVRKSLKKSYWERKKNTGWTTLTEWMQRALPVIFIF